MKYYKAEVFSTFYGAAKFLADNLKDGWELSEEDPPHPVGFCFYIGLVRDDEPVVKLTRAEILTKARAARSHHNKEKSVA